MPQGVFMTEKQSIFEIKLSRLCIAAFSGSDLNASPRYIETYETHQVFGYGVKDDVFIADKTDGHKILIPLRLIVMVDIVTLK